MDNHWEDEDRIPKGNGKESGRWTKDGGAKEYRQNTSYHEILSGDKSNQAQNKIPQLERQGSEIQRIWQIQENTGLSYKEAEQTYSAIKHYTRAGFRAIRDGQAPKEEQLIENFIDRHPKYDGKIWRGIAVDDESILKKLYLAQERGGLIDMKGISSWSGFESIANDFTDNRQGEFKIVFELDNQSGVGIDHLSDWEGENEVIQSGKIKYKIKDIIFENGKYKIKAEEV